MSYYPRLIFNAVDFSAPESGITPHLFCPVCKYQFTATGNFGSISGDPYDYNQLMSFPIPSHTSLKTGSACIFPYNAIRLYVAVHRDVNGVQLIIQRSDAEGAGGIPANWWQNP